jgi:phytoene dehydrogenase-like protein
VTHADERGGIEAEDERPEDGRGDVAVGRGDAETDAGRRERHEQPDVHDHPDAPGDRPTGALEPADLERETGSIGGSIYGTSSNGARAAFLRPGNVSPVPGLFLVGGSAHPGGGLPLVALSAEIVARLVGRA